MIAQENHRQPSSLNNPHNHKIPVFMRVTSIPETDGKENINPVTASFFANLVFLLRADINLFIHIQLQSFKAGILYIKHKQIYCFFSCNFIHLYKALIYYINFSDIHRMIFRL